MSKILSLIQKILSLFNINIDIKLKFGDKKIKIFKNKRSVIIGNETKGETIISNNEDCAIKENKFK